MERGIPYERYECFDSGPVHELVCRTGIPDVSAVVKGFCDLLGTKKAQTTMR